MLKAKGFLALIALLFIIILSQIGCGLEDLTDTDTNSDTGTNTTISGTVTLQSGSGLSGVTMTLSGYDSATTTTDASGKYSFNNLRTNNSSYTTYYVTPSKTGYTFSPSYSVDVTFGSAGGQASVNFTAKTK